ncbi:hypothetical protein ACFQMM_16135 [Saliphagus sp. GCM10025308]
MSEQENTGRPTVPDVTRRTLLRSAAIGTVAGLGATAAVAQDDNEDGFLQEGPTVGLETVAEELTAPVDFQVADEETDRRFVVDQTGQIYVHGEDGLEDEPFLDISDRMVDLREDFDERGLLGLALHPDFEENGRFFVRYSAPPREETPEEWSHTFVLSEFETEGDDNESADPDSEQVLQRSTSRSPTTTPAWSRSVRTATSTSPRVTAAVRMTTMRATSRTGTTRTRAATVRIRPRTSSVPSFGSTSTKEPARGGRRRRRRDQRPGVRYSRGQSLRRARGVRFRRGTSGAVRLGAAQPLGEHGFPR